MMHVRTLMAVYFYTQNGMQISAQLVLQLTKIDAQHQT